MIQWEVVSSICSRSSEQKVGLKDKKKLFLSDFDSKESFRDDWLPLGNRVCIGS